MSELNAFQALLHIAEFRMILLYPKLAQNYSVLHYHQYITERPRTYQCFNGPRLYYVRMTSVNHS